jgi:phosphoribosylformylglycinamidine synthase PurS subunit
MLIFVIINSIFSGGIKMFQAQIKVMLKKTVADPQGLTVKHALQSLGFDNLAKVRMGKFITVELEEETKEKAEESARIMSEKLLSNPIIEDFSIEVLPI